MSRMYALSNSCPQISICRSKYRLIPCMILFYIIQKIIDAVSHLRVDEILVCDLERVYWFHHIKYFILHIMERHRLLSMLSHLVLYRLQFKHSKINCKEKTEC